MPRENSRRLAFILFFAAPVFCLAALAQGFSHAQDFVLTQSKGGQQQQQQGAPAETPTPPANSVIHGRAVFDETNRPVRRASVHIMSASNGYDGQEHVALTDAAGQFRIEGVPAGSYFVYVVSPGVLVPQTFTQYSGFAGHFDELFRYFTLVEVDGKADKEVEVRARLGGSIAGRVVYTDGTPAPGVSVNVTPRKNGRDVQFFSRAARTQDQTDERGRYRVTGLAPGDYVVAASELISHGGQTVAAGITSTLMQTYYPSESKPEKATVVTVGAGDEREDVDITIAERETHSIAGAVRGRHDGQPVAGARVMFTVKDGAGLESPFTYINATTTDEEGRWRFKEMPDGEYTINVTPPPEPGDEEEGDGDEGEDEPRPRAKPTPTPPKKNYAPGQISVSIAGNDVSDLLITLGQAARIAGTLTVAGGGQLPENKFIYASQVAGGSAQQLSGMAEVNEAAFKIEGLAPGKYALLVHTSLQAFTGVPDAEKNELFVKSITWHGRDLTREPLELKEGESVDGVSIVFAPGRASLRLRAYVAGQDKPPARGIYVGLVPTDRSQRYKSDLPFCTTDKDGACTLSGPPGEYAVVTARVGEMFNISDEAEVERRIANAPRVTLRAGEPDTFELTVPGGN